MLSFEFLIDNIFVIVGGRVFQKTVGIHMGTNCAPLLADLFPYSYEADFIQGFLKKNEKKPSRSFNFTFRYIDDVLSPNNSRFGFDLIFFFGVLMPLSAIFQLYHGDQF